MKHGDFTELAKFYIHRPGYSLDALEIIRAYLCRKMQKESLEVADVGAGTGKLTENLSELGLSGYAVEPNDAMRAEGEKALAGKPFAWVGAPAEMTTLPDHCVDWVLMGSSFHWTDAPVALMEFARILRPGGFFTAIWNPRDIEKNELHQRIEKKIAEMVPGMKRVSSGSSSNMQGMEEKLLSTPCFDHLFFLEAPHAEIMTKKRYLGAWKSVNDIRVQAGDTRFEAILSMIEREIEPLERIEVPYKSRAWTVRNSTKPLFSETDMKYIYISIINVALIYH